MMENKCKMRMGCLIFILGIIFLLKDLGVWNFWGISVGTVAFIIVGIAVIKHAKHAGACCGGSCGSHVEEKVAAPKAKKKAKKKKK